MRGSGTRPNILLIVPHDTGDYFGCYGRGTVRTPNIDALADEGVRFANSFCTAPQCSPSRASIFTGSYPQTHGVLGLAQIPFRWKMKEGITALPELLSRAGYETVLLAGQHATFDTSQLGFRFIMPPDDPVKNAVTFIGDRKDDSKPFFAHLMLDTTHRKFRFEPDTTLGVSVPRFLPDCPASREDFALFQGAIYQLDKEIGLILQALRDSGLEEDTLVVFVTDHGIPFPRAKCTLYDPGIKTAFILRWPAGEISGGRIIEHLVSHVDIAPTLLELLGLEVPDKMQGRSFANILSGGETQPPRREIFAQKTFHNFYDPMRCVRTERYKLIVRFSHSGFIETPADVLEDPLVRQYLAVEDDRYIRGENEMIELYDLSADPAEQRNLANDERYGRIKEGLLSKLLDWMEEVDDPILRGPIPSRQYEEIVSSFKDRQRAYRL